jgi:hypothetical protein
VLALRSAWIAAVAIACSGSHKPATTAPATGDGAETGTACEPGRCLEDISATVKQHRPAARACFDAAAAKNPALQGGRLIINFRIDAEGKVSEVSQGMQDDQISDEGVIACVGGVIEKLEFARSPAGKATRAYHQFEFARR